MGAHLPNGFSIETMILIGKFMNKSKIPYCITLLLGFLHLSAQANPMWTLRNFADDSEIIAIFEILEERSEEVTILEPRPNNLDPLPMQATVTFYTARADVGLKGITTGDIIEFWVFGGSIGDERIDWSVEYYPDIHEKIVLFLKMSESGIGYRPTAGIASSFGLIEDNTKDMDDLYIYSHLGIEIRAELNSEHKTTTRDGPASQQEAQHAVTFSKLVGIING